MDHQYLFVFGLPRSGTTIVMDLLNIHSDIFITSESQWPFNLYDLLTKGDPKAWFHFHLIKEDKSPFLISLSRLTNMYELDPFRLIRSFGENLRSQFNNPKIIGDKDVYNCSRVPLIREIFPNCKIILVHRPLDECIESAYSSNCHLGNPVDTPKILKREYDLLWNIYFPNLQDKLVIELHGLKQDRRGQIQRMLMYLGVDVGKYDMDKAISMVKS